ncbi:MAG: hypothetical protein A2X25_07310 [Chloroflexi bacterium GWB2_49_20]|nr:MAG: hypothetical protein A2X25_07310 [Chloroflexi bacterium GWB2_49_20]OGN77965.1 MAG: hypothetical protein A2X26_15115 [Chloroflexi bacterium GWC2_49_37]OGN85003.1 MAG: hypothetical protein A2X27_09815 [Chloroflexi bacterium GWD2_49_16]
MRKEAEIQAAFERSAVLFMVFVFAISLLALTGWLFNKPILASLRPDYIPMAPSSALILLGLSTTWFLNRIFPIRRGIRILVQAGLVGMLVIVLILSLRSLTGVGSDLEQWLYPTPALFGQILTARMSPLTALGFFLVIPAFLLLTGHQSGKRTRSASAALSLAVFTLSSLNMLGYLYGAPLLYGGTLIPMAVTTALSFWFLSLASLLTAGPTCWPVRMYVGPSLKARFIRAFIPSSILIVLVQGLFSTAVPWIVNPGMKVAVAVFVAMMIVLLIISLIAKNLSAEMERGKKAEEALQASEAELRALFTSMHDVVLVIDRDGVYRKIAPTNPELLVKPPEELLGKTLRDVFLPEQAVNFFNAIKKVLDTKQTARIEYDLIIGDRTVWFETSISPLTEDSTLWVAHDITQRKRAEEALRENEARLDLTLQLAGMGVWHMDINKNKRYFDDQTCRLLGINSATFTGAAEEFIGVVHPDDQETIKVELARTIEQDVLYEPEYRVVWADGSVHYITSRARLSRDDKGAPIKVNGILWDITERKQVEEELVKLREAMDDSNEAIFMTDCEGVITFVNPGFTHLYGYTADEVVGKTTPRILKSGRMKPDDYATLWQTLLNKQVIRGELINKTKDGRLLNIEGSANPILNQQEEIIGFLAIQRDITEHKRAEKVQETIYRITQAAITSNGIEVLYQSIQTILGELITTENFYIALYDPVNELISFPYYVDQYDEAPTAPTKIQGLTGYVLRTGHPLLATREILDQLVGQGEVEAVGTVGVDWIGAPLKVEGRMIGVMAVQSYTEGIHFDQEDLNLLEFVSTQVAQAIERKRMEEEIRSLSLTDELTGLYNRRGFTLLAEQELKLAQRLKRSELLLFGDLDNLKMINDTWGHTQGDQALMEVGTILKETLRGTDIAARFGGDEFVVLAMDVSMESADILINHIQSALERSNQQGSRPFQLSISIGIATYDPEAPCTVSELIAQADGLMYAQKQAMKGKK